jgi:ABC-type glycerol-3-phosphate transport system substrate-binding protein
MATVILLFCLAGCQAKKEEKVGNCQEKNGESMGKTEDHAGSEKGNNGINETGNNGISDSHGMLKLAVVCVEVGGPQKSWIEVLADEYNKNHLDAPVTIVPFGDAKLMEVDKAMAQLSVAIAGDDPPDLILLQNITSRLDPLVSQGYVEDLTPFAERSEIVHLEDYYQKVLDCGRKEGVLTVIPKTFAISTLVTSQNVFDGNSGWTYSQMLYCCKAHETSPLLPGSSPEMLLFEILRESVDAFVDEDQNKCHFDSEEFKSFLEYVGTYCAWSSRQYEYIDSEEEGSALREGKILAKYEAIFWLSELKNIRRDFGHTANFVGFPSKYGRPVYRITMSGDDSFAMTSTSNKKEAAWKFIEWYLCKEDEYDNLELCADRKRMEEKVGIALAGRENVNDGEPAMTEEDRETLEILLEQLEPLSDDDIPLYRIAYAEARTYFSGDKSLDEVIDVIQKRATLYMNEK